MTEFIEVTTTGMDELLQHIGSAGTRLGPWLVEETERAAEQLRDRAREIFEDQRSGSYLPHYAASITYEMKARRGGIVSAEVGPESGKEQGGMGPGIEFGSVNHAPMPHLIPASAEVGSQYANRLSVALGRVT